MLVFDGVTTAFNMLLCLEEHLRRLRALNSGKAPVRHRAWGDEVQEEKKRFALFESFLARFYISKNYLNPEPK